LGDELKTKELVYNIILYCTVQWNK
jgi:hypothetical protein